MSAIIPVLESIGALPARARGGFDCKHPSKKSITSKHIPFSKLIVKTKKAPAPQEVRMRCARRGTGVIIALIGPACVFRKIRLPMILLEIRQENPKNPKNSLRAPEDRPISLPTNATAGFSQPKENNNTAGR
jgi:hypothetical protein